MDHKSMKKNGDDKKNMYLPVLQDLQDHLLFPLADRYAVPADQHQCPTIGFVIHFDLIGIDQVGMVGA